MGVFALEKYNTLAADEGFDILQYHKNIGRMNCILLTVHIIAIRSGIATITLYMLIHQHVHHCGKGVTFSATKEEESSTTVRRVVVIVTTRISMSRHD